LHSLGNAPDSGTSGAKVTKVTKVTLCRDFASDYFSCEMASVAFFLSPLSPVVWHFAKRIGPQLRAVMRPEKRCDGVSDEILKTVWPTTSSQNEKR
jgi:hypothetical protein